MIEPTAPSVAPATRALPSVLAASISPPAWLVRAAVPAGRH
jgi:hypothetical protein